MFKLAHTTSGWKENVLNNFRGSSDGVGGEESLIVDDQGNLYGASGSVAFEITP